MKYLVIVFILLGFGLYLNRSYAHIYTFVSSKKLVSPTVNQIMIISPSSSNYTKKITYVALGDSLTAGVGATGAGKTYPYLLAKLLAEKENAEITLVNLGQPGAKAEDVLKNQVPFVASHKPDFVTLAIGTNDMHGRVPDVAFSQTIATIVESLASTTAHLNVINVPYLGSKSVFLPPYRLYFDWRTRHYNNLLSSALLGRQLNIIDVYSATRGRAMSDSTYYSTDGFHPSDTGYDFWSTSIYDLLNY